MEEHSSKTMAELMFDCEYQSTRLSVIDILKALRVSVNQIETTKFSGDYYIININIKEKNVQINSFLRNDLAKASEEYLEIEKSILNNENAVVLFSSSSLRSLKKAYPSYFLDTSEFINALEKINENCNLLRSSTS